MNPLILHADAKEIIHSHLPPIVRSNICSVIEQAYTLTKEAIRHTTILNWELGQFHEGYLRNIAIGYLFQQQIELKQLPLSYTYEYNRNRSHKYLVLSLDKVKMTFSQVQSPYTTARPAYFRDKLQQLNQGTLYFPDIDDHDLIQEKQDQYYLLLTYSRGGDAPEFVNIGFPHQWRERIDLLKEPRLIHSSQDNRDPEENITADQLIDFRDFMKEVDSLGNQ